MNSVALKSTIILVGSLLVAASCCGQDQLVSQTDAAYANDGVATGSAAKSVSDRDAQERAMVGLRTEDSWFSFEPVYTGEVFSNAKGGRTTSQATQYLGLLDLGITLDFRNRGWRIPGKFFLLAQNTHGRGLTEDFIGDSQVISNIDSFDNIMQVSEYWWEFSLWQDRVTFRLGKQDLNDEFLFINAAEHFIQSTFGLSPSTAFPTYPDQSIGAVVLTQLTEEWQLKAGIWNAFARGSSFGFAGDDTVLVVGELERSYTLGTGLPGVFAIGAVYESAGEVDGERLSPVQEYFVQLEQAIYREPTSAEDSFEGLSVFGGFYPRFTGIEIGEGSIGNSFVGGLIYTGLLPQRSEDVLGLGVASAELFGGGTNRENVTEMFYRCQVTPRAVIQPDIQYIASPSGIYQDSLAIGIRYQLQF